MFRGARCSLNDLPTLDPDLYRNLLRLRDHLAANPAADLGLTFTAATHQQDFNGGGQQAEVELKPGGRNIPVTADNVQEYIHRMAHYKSVKERGEGGGWGRGGGVGGPRPTANDADPERLTLAASS